MPISYLELILIEIITMVKDLLVNCLVKEKQGPW